MNRILRMRAVKKMKECADKKKCSSKDAIKVESKTPNKLTVKLISKPISKSGVTKKYKMTVTKKLQ